jgi:hypothetical protein
MAIPMASLALTFILLSFPICLKGLTSLCFRICALPGDGWEEAGEPGGHEDALEPALGVDEALGCVYQHTALRDQGTILVVDLAVVPVGLGGHLLEPAAAAECGLQAVASGLLDNEKNPGVCIGEEDHVGVVDLDELQEIGEDDSLRSFKPLLATVEDLDPGDLPGEIQVSEHLHPPGCSKELGS